MRGSMIRGEEWIGVLLVRIFAITVQFAVLLKCTAQEEPRHFCLDEPASDFVPFYRGRQACRSGVDVLAVGSTAARVT